MTVRVSLTRTLSSGLDDDRSAVSAMGAGRVSWTKGARRQRFGARLSGTQLDRDGRLDAERVLTQFLDDPSPLVRRAMAEAFARASNAPHHVVLALADDQSDISSIVLGRSPILSDSELIDCAAIGDAIAQSAIALRPSLSVAVAAALAEVGAREALISLAVNASVDLPEFSMRRMIERFGFDGELREALLGRRNLPAPLRADLVGATANALGDFVTSCDWLSPERAQRLIREARDQAHVIIAATSQNAPSGPMQLVAHLRGSGQLTASLLLRALLSGNGRLFEAALAHLADVPQARVEGLMRDWRSAGFAALYRKAGLAEPLLPAFRAAIQALDAPEFASEFWCASVSAKGGARSDRLPGDAKHGA